VIVCCPYSKSEWPGGPCVPTRLVNGMFFHIPDGMVTCLWGFCKPSYMPRVHRVAYSSIPSPFHSSSSAEYSKFAY
jgi:hypothetical protein